MPPTTHTGGGTVQAAIAALAADPNCRAAFAGRVHGDTVPPGNADYPWCTVDEDVEATHAQSDNTVIADYVLMVTIWGEGREATRVLAVQAWAVVMRIDTLVEGQVFTLINDGFPSVRRDPEMSAGGRDLYKAAMRFKHSRAELFKGG